MAALIRADAWLARALARPVHVVDPGDGAWQAEQADRVAAHMRAHPGGMYAARLACGRADQARGLCALGFYPVEVAVTLRRDPGAPAPPGPPGVVDASPDDAEALGGIAGRAFAQDRFHADPGVPDPAADAVKAAWAANLARGERGIECRVALAGGRPAGFLGVVEGRRGAERRRVIDLVAVDPGHRGQGLGRALVADFVARHAGACDALAVGTQAANTASIALYEGLGFRFESARVALHAHVPG